MSLYAQNSKGNFTPKGIEIVGGSTCDFKTLIPVDNNTITDIYLAAKNEEVTAKKKEKLIQFIEQNMGINQRYHCSPEQDSLTMARQALSGLLVKYPEAIQADFLIFACISNPLPTVCTSALLAGEFELENASCWDLKSGCSSGVLGLIQATQWFNSGAKSGILVCAENLSKFTPQAALQMLASTGDGAVAMYLKASSNPNVLALTHGTKGKYLKNMYVPGRYPIEPSNFNQDQYKFTFDQKADTLKILADHWESSLEELLSAADVPADSIKHYIAHQVDGVKNKLFAQNQGINESSIALNFRDFGNMGCPTIFINYLKWIEAGNVLSTDDLVMFHAVGGGLSWAGVLIRI